MAGEKFVTNEKMFDLLQNAVDKLTEVQLELKETKGEFKKDSEELKGELKETRSEMKKYNGLKQDLSNTVKKVLKAEEDINKLNEKVSIIETIADTKDKVVISYREWVGWFLAGLSSLVLILNLLGVI